MGLFLMGPLALQLQDAAESGSPVLPAMRLLTVLVPLVYRPALKVCTCNPLRPAPISPASQSNKGVALG